MENVKEFFKDVLKTDEAKALLATLGTPESEQDRVDAYLRIAKKLGIELTAEDILAYFNAPAIEELAYGELDDEELAQLTGGTGTEAGTGVVTPEHPSCQVSYRHFENCWWDDGCDRIYNGYPYYNCKNFSMDHGDKRDNPPVPGTEVWLPW